MTIDEIKQAWRQSKMNPLDDNGNIKAGSTHGKFTGEMALKTVINRTCKAIINSSSDNALLLERINRAEDLADRADAEMEIEEQANTGDVIDITEGQKEAAALPEAEKQEQGAECPLKQPARMPGF